jgi:hypothetical protein
VAVQYVLYSRRVADFFPAGAPHFSRRHFMRQVTCVSCQSDFLAQQGRGRNGGLCPPCLRGNGVNVQISTVLQKGTTST